VKGNGEGDTTSRMYLLTLKIGFMVFRHATFFSSWQSGAMIFFYYHRRSKGHDGKTWLPFLVPLSVTET